MALVTLVDKITTAINDGDYVLGLFIDFSKAFDCINHNILFQKLEHYGVRGVALQWFESYLYNRQQYVTFDGVNSDMKTIVCGVPQGSILGPLLFLLYVNDIVNAIPKLFSLLYADDTNSFKTGKKLSEIFAVMNSEICELVKWLNINMLKLNVKKKHYMIFSSQRKNVIHDEKLYVNGKEINQVSHTKFLGVIIDDKLSWDYHIKHIRNKIVKGIGIVSKAKKYLNKSCLRTLYSSIIYPYLTYCIEVWGSATQSRLNPLFILQKKAIRIISQSGYRDHTAPLFKKLHLLNLKNIYFYQIGIFMFKFHHGILPPIFNDMFQTNTNIHSYSTRQRNQLHVPVAKYKCLQLSVRFKGVSIWNTIRSKLDIYCSIHSYKSSLRKFLLAEDVE